MEKVNFILKMDHSIKELLFMVTHKVKEGISIIMAVYMKAPLKIIKLLVLVPILIHIKGTIMKEIGMKMFLQVKGNKNFQMVPITKDNLKMGSKMGKGDISPIRVSMKESLNWENLMEKVISPTPIIKNMLVNGKMELSKEKVYFHGLMEIDMMANTLMD
jgi:hypothetical protein